MTSATRSGLRCVVALAVINFMVFFIAAVMLGGDAMNGRVVNGHYFLAEHGKRTEVSQAVFSYSLWHVRSLFISHPLGMLAGWLLYRSNKQDGKA